MSLLGAAARFPALSPPASDSLGARDAGTAGGPIDVRVPPTLGRGLDVVIDGVLAFDGVPVLEGAALDPLVDSGFVGDLVGD